MGIRRVLALVILGLAGLGLQACEDDPVLPPTGSEPDDGGSYGQMRFDVVPAADPVSPDSSGTTRESPREVNPRLF